MLIRCPECQFEREIDTAKIPASASVATCPKCGERFHFRDPQTGEFVQFESRSTPVPPVRLPTEQDGDDPLPPGAVIPNLGAPKVQAVPTAAKKTEKPEPGPGADHPKPTLTLGFLLDKLNSLLPPKHESKTEPTPLFPSKQEEEEEQGSPLAWREDWSKGVPWENPDDYGLFSGLYHTILAVMFSSRNFFTHVWSTQPLTMAAIFYVLLHYFSTIASNLWSMAPISGISTAPDVAMAGTMGVSIPLLLIILPFAQLLGMFIQAGLYHLMIRLVQPEEADFPTTARVIAYSSAPLILSVVPFIGSLIGSLWSLVLSFTGCKYAHNLSWGRVTLALAPLFIIEFAISYQLIGAMLTMIDSLPV